MATHSAEAVQVVSSSLVQLLLATTFAGWAGLSGNWGWHADDGIDDRLFVRLARAGRLTVNQMAPLAAQIVHLHDTAEPVTDQRSQGGRPRPGAGMAEDKPADTSPQPG